jgi:streptogramin lyase
VWFGEQAIPGVAHLFSNGTLVEYPWPENTLLSGSTSSCPNTPSIWGVAIWDGKVWGTDTDNNQLLGIDPATGSVQTVRIPEQNSLPYTLTVSPDNSLWFTLLANPPSLGRLDSQGRVQLFPITSDRKEIPTELIFVNSSTAYFSALDPGSANASIFEFNPSETLSAINPRVVGKGFSIFAPSSLTYIDGTLWVTQHGASSLVSYNISSHTWRTYPTSVVNYTYTTLPYFVRSSQSLVWFNEHYADKIAILDPRTSQLTEFSVSNPPARNGNQIGNTITLAVGHGKTWFTEWTANYVGYVDQAFLPSFSVAPIGNGTIVLREGSQTMFDFRVTGQSQGPLTVQFSDSENYTSRPRYISLSSAPSVISSLNGTQDISMTIDLKSALKRGEYFVLVTVSDGSVFRSEYFTLDVVP